MGAGLAIWSKRGGNEGVVVSRMPCCDRCVVGGCRVAASFHVIDKGGFVIGYDQRARGAAWVYEVLTPQGDGPCTTRTKGFHEDKETPSAFSRKPPITSVQATIAGTCRQVQTSPIAPQLARLQTSTATCDRS